MASSNNATMNGTGIKNHKNDGPKLDWEKFAKSGFSIRHWPATSDESSKKRKRGADRPPVCWASDCKPSTPASTSGPHFGSSGWLQYAVTWSGILPTG